MSDSVQWTCPKCGALTVRDMFCVFERCLNCGWYREMTPQDKEFWDTSVKKWMQGGQYDGYGIHSNQRVGGSR